MVSIHLIRKYKLTAPQYVERFHEAMADVRLVWSPVHKAHYTQVGYVSRNQLKKLGLYDTAHPEDFIFMTKAEMRKKEAEYKEASRKRSNK